MKTDKEKLIEIFKERNIKYEFDENENILSVDRKMVDGEYSGFTQFLFNPDGTLYAVIPYA